MHRISHWLSRHAAALFFPAALILYDFSAYLTTDLIQPGILHVVRDFNADVALAPASVSLYMAGGMALQWLLGPPVSYTHLRAHETRHDLVCRLLLEKKKIKKKQKKDNTE